jgi:hypothetical protein
LAALLVFLSVSAEEGLSIHQQVNTAKKPAASQKAQSRIEHGENDVRSHQDRRQAI